MKNYQLSSSFYNLNPISFGWVLSPSFFFPQIHSTVNSNVNNNSPCNYVYSGSEKYKILSLQIVKYYTFFSLGQSFQLLKLYLFYGFSLLSDSLLIPEISFHLHFYNKKFFTNPQLFNNFKTPCTLR
eukprot:TRINITY_DN29686_c0_g1_i1.p1 TRINITY_DN29686_c0_g1~~TRINITY_DN29686_c0_g1_i1.p1  ORF type:complete len:127 (-),score=0.55 TRINITY_DN29686_c0_g1_i1:3-383(-)